MEVSHQEQGNTESQGRREAIKPNHIKTSISTPTPTPKVSLTTEALQKSWRCRFEGEMKKMTADTKGVGDT